MKCFDRNATLLTIRINITDFRGETIMELIYKFISHSPFHRNHLIGFRKARRGGKGSFVSQRNRGTRTREEEEEEGET